MESYLGSEQCVCGKVHDVAIDNVVFGKGASSRIPEFIKKYNCQKPFLLADRNTFTAAGNKVCDILKTNGISYSKYVFQNDHLEPNEESVGSAVMHFDTTLVLAPV